MNKERIDNYTMQKVEQLVCNITNNVFELNTDNKITEDNVYNGKKNIQVAKSLARNFIIFILHNRYGFSYSEISQRTTMKISSTMRCVRKFATLLSYDPMYIKVQNLINNFYKEKYGR